MSSLWQMPIRRARGPFSRKDYIAKFRTLTKGLITEKESERFLAAAQGLPDLKDLGQLNVEAAALRLPHLRGIF